ncbi:O-antigen ligase family protein, partial [bacterium]|nr:O-antigen ligase family protein [bacterium]
MSQFLKTNKNNTFSSWLAVFIIAELLSWLFFNFSDFSWIVLALIALVTIALSLRNPIYTIYLPLAELFWGSLGHSFDYNIFNTRLVIFLAVVLVFILQNVFKIKKIKFIRDKGLAILWFFMMFLVIVGIVSAYYKGFELQKIFLDANAYFYLLYLPIWYQAYDRRYIENIVSILKAAAIIIAVKTLIVFNIFVQDYKVLNIDLIYKWIRDTRTGEITPFDNGCFRIFMQSQFYLLVAWFFLFLNQLKDYKNKINFWQLSLISAALLVSLSRSLWLGGVVGLLFLLINIFFYQKKYLSLFIISILIGILVSSIILVQIFFNLPRFNSFNIFSQRTTDVSEPAASSRQQLLEPMWLAIKERPIIGHGFAKELTYRSSDPRIKNKNNP